MSSLISIDQLTRSQIDLLIERGLSIKYEGTQVEGKHSNKKIASLFFENSTRTRLSSETAGINLGSYVNGFTGVEGTSVKKGEPLLDTARMLEGYGYDAMVVRHPLEGAAQYISENISIPVINAGDGSNGHPTQTLLDLMTIFEKYKRIDDLSIALVGDLKYGRTVHSMVQALKLYHVKLYLVSPPELQIPRWRITDYSEQTGRTIEECHDLKEILPKIDVLYMTRIQRERFPSGIEGESDYQKVSGAYTITTDLLINAKKTLSILHPLPRDKNNLEIRLDVDRTPHALYFEQAKNGLYMRQAIWEKLFDDGDTLLIPEKEKVDAAFQELPIVNGAKTGEKLVYRLDNGTLVDHIDQGRGEEIYRILGLDQCIDHEVVMGKNIRSDRFGRKDIIAIHGKILTPEELCKLAVLCPDHTVNFIQDQRVFRKVRVILPSVLEEVISCSNPKCVTREEHREFATSRFEIIQNEPLKVRCQYCEQIVGRDSIELSK